jgi:hypothetical protein
MKMLAFLLALWTFPAMAEMRIDGDALIYNAPTYDYALNRPSDADGMGNLLRSNPNVRRLVLSGSFEITRDALDVARVVADFGLDTEAQGECSDGCLYILVAGKTRTLDKGALLHLRRIVIPTEVLRAQFEHQKASYGWADEFGQASYMYDRAQNDMRDALGFLLDHGVSVDFVLQVFDTPRQDFWTPTREELVAGGVIGK